MKKSIIRNLFLRLIKKFLFLFLILLVFGHAIFLYPQEDKVRVVKNLYQNKEYKKIIELLEEEINNAKDLDSQIYLLYSYSLWNLGYTDKSIDALFLALKRKPSPEIFSQLVRAYSSSNKFKGAMELCEAGIKKFPEDISLQIQKGYLLARFRKINEALRLAEVLKSKFPEDPKPLELEAYIYSLRKEWDKAEIALEWASSLDRTNPTYKNNLAIVYEKLAEKQNSKEKSLEYLQKAKDKLTEAIQTVSKPAYEQNLKRINDKLSQIQ